PCAAALCASGECIEYNDTFGCFNTTCGANEEFIRCPSCEPTCGPAVPCVPICLTPACRCVDGYVRDNGKCIMRSDCRNSFVGG
ncbi:trypsin Inhibitor like cysteine rich domain protein, partial [Cooperia oncophora]